MIIKCTMLFQLATGTESPNPSLRRIGGWSESFYADVASMSDAITLVNGASDWRPTSLCPARAALLPNSAQIIGQRFQQVSPVGRSQSLNQIWNGSSGYHCDIPQMALLTRIPAAGASNIRPYMIRGIPDSLVQDGEFAPEPNYNRAITGLFTSLSQFCMRVKSGVVFPEDIASIDGTGKIIFNAVRPAIAVGSYVTLAGVRVSGGVVSGTFRVASIGPESLAMTIASWTSGPGLGGTGVQTTTTHPTLDGSNATVGRIIVKKVGRPFVAYRGRATVRRKRPQHV